MRMTEAGGAGWAEPIEMLGACHGHFTDHLETMASLAERAMRLGIDAAARHEALEVLRHFSVASANHHEDEERDLFPALLAAVPREQRRATQELIERLIAEHQRMAELCEPILASIFKLSQGKPAKLAREDVETLARLYREHMQLEAERIMPLARQFLSQPMLRSLSVTMSVRRGFRLEDLPARTIASA